MNNEMVGYLVTWKLKNAVFIEHFEILETYRNQKLGSKVLLEFSVFYPFLILESEPSFQSEIAERRIAFYKRNNFKKIKEDYIQPAYDKDKPSLQLFLLSNFEVENIDTVVKEIHAIVYSVS
jgi:ribosomal protein S18 acetylase RimI-like enzyme